MRYLLVIGLPAVTFFLFWGMLEVISDLFYHSSEYKEVSWRLLKLIIPANIATAVFRGILISKHPG
jgi:hypothetical protein